MVLYWSQREQWTNSDITVAVYQSYLRAAIPDQCRAQALFQGLHEEKQLLLRAPTHKLGQQLLHWSLQLLQF